MGYLLALDQGTSSTRAMLYNKSGELVASEQLPLTQYYPHPGWVEHDPEELWQAALTVLQKVTLQVAPGSILACGITNQRETTVIWDKSTGQCVAPAIVWQDRRTEDFCATLKEKKILIQQKTGLLLDPYFSASKINWLLTHHPKARELALDEHLAFGTIDTFLIWRLTKGIHATDSTNASRTMLFNINTEQWDTELLDLFAIPHHIMPEVRASDAFFGVIHKEFLGLEIPITGVVGDQQAALIGQGCLSKGMVKATFGTGGFIVMNTGEKPVFSKHQMLTTIAYKIKEHIVYALEGSIYHAGTTIKWLRDELKLISTSAETEILAKSLASNEGVYLISAFTGLGAPYWLSAPGGAIVGLSRTTNKAHLARAALEGVCYQTRDILYCMREDSELSAAKLRVDGGMAANNWFLQFLAEQCQLIVQKPKHIESTAKGAALLAGLGCGLYHSLHELESISSYEKEYSPQQAKNITEKDYLGWQKAVKKMEVF